LIGQDALDRGNGGIAADPGIETGIGRCLFSSGKPKASGWKALTSNG
jgi:hypothetical protein